MKSQYSNYDKSRNQFSLSVIEQREFDNLVNEVASMSFSRSFDVSSYIVKNKLGLKYRHISGVVTMEADGRDWRFCRWFSNLYICQIMRGTGSIEQWQSCKSD